MPGPHKTLMAFRGLQPPGSPARACIPPKQFSGQHEAGNWHTLRHPQGRQAPAGTRQCTGEGPTSTCPHNHAFQHGRCGALVLGSLVCSWLDPLVLTPAHRPQAMLLPWKAPHQRLRPFQLQKPSRPQRPRVATHSILSRYTCISVLPAAKHQP